MIKVCKPELNKRIKEGSYSYICCKQNQKQIPLVHVDTYRHLRRFTTLFLVTLLPFNRCFSSRCFSSHSAINKCVSVFCCCSNCNLNNSKSRWPKPVGSVKQAQDQAGYCKNVPWELSQLALSRDYAKKVDPCRMLVWLGRRTVPQNRVSTLCYLAGRYKLGRSCSNSNLLRPRVGRTAQDIKGRNRCTSQSRRFEVSP